MDKFGTYISEKRKQKGLSLRKMAQLLDITPSYLSDIEKGRRYAPDKEKIIKIAKILELDSQLDKLYDLAGESKDDLPPDIAEYVMKKDKVKVLLRTARNNNLTDKELDEIIRRIEQKE